MYTYELTPNIKSKTYRILQDGIEKVRNLSKSTAKFFCDQVNLVYRETHNDSSNSDLSLRIDPRLSLQLESKSDNSFSNTPDGAGIGIKGTESNRNGDDGFETRGDSMESQPIQEESQLSCITESRGEQNQGSNSKLPGWLSGTFKESAKLHQRLSRVSNSIVDESKRVTDEIIDESKRVTDEIIGYSDEIIRVSNRIAEVATIAIGCAGNLSRDDVESLIRGTSTGTEVTSRELNPETITVTSVTVD